MLSIIQAAGWPIWPLIACSVLALALIFERFISLKSNRIIPPKLLDEAISVSSQSLPGPDVVGKLAQNSALGEVLATGLRTLNSNPRTSEADLRAAMEGAGRVVAHRLEKYLSALATIASAAPLLGLLGTVVGMIQMFLGIQDSGVGDVNALAGGIGKDTYRVDDAGDVVIELADGGSSDRVTTTLASYTLDDNVERLTFIGTGSFAAARTISSLLK